MNGAYAGKRVGVTVVRDVHVADFGVDQPVPGDAVQQQPGSDAGSDGQVAQSVGGTAGGMAAYAKKCVSSRRQPERDANGP